MVTGAYGFTGRYITRLLLEKGYEVKTLTGHPDRPDPFNGRVKAAPFNFENTALLVKELEGADVVFNTYWVRFNYGHVTYGRAVANVQNLMRASVDARVPRFAHISITNPSEESSSSYFRGKALMEKTLVKSGLSYAIVRPTVLFG
ncbi:MAG: NAD(P)H-binding protein, partial [Deltaproteobacteria bacterium]|nr:NAD(P)H-binding protein [Deltaproteobacteria bacterium]